MELELAVAAKVDHDLILFRYVAIGLPTEHDRGSSQPRIHDLHSSFSRYSDTQGICCWTLCLGERLRLCGARRAFSKNREQSPVVRSQQLGLPMGWLVC